MHSNRSEHPNNKVLHPANFDDHKFVDSETQALIDAGMFVGMTVVLKKRITVEFIVGKTKQRKDLNVGHHGVIKGVIGELVVVSWTTIFAKNEVFADHAVKVGLIEQAEEPGKAGTSKASGSGSKEPVHRLGKYSFVEAQTEDSASTPGKEVIAITNKWATYQSCYDPKVSIHYCQSALSLAIGRLSHAAPEFTEKDLLVITRDGAYEVWALRDFKAKELCFVPCSTDLRDRFWSQNRVCRIGNSDNIATAFDLDKKPMVIDGRNRAMVDDKRSFSLFWLIKQTTEKTLRTWLWRKLR